MEIRFSRKLYLIRIEWPLPERGPGRGLVCFSFFLRVNSAARPTPACQSGHFSRWKECGKISFGEGENFPICPGTDLAKCPSRLSHSQRFLNLPKRFRIRGERGKSPPRLLAHSTAPSAEKKRFCSDLDFAEIRLFPEGGVNNFAGFFNCPPLPVGAGVPVAP